MAVNKRPKNIMETLDELYNELKCCKKDSYEYRLIREDIDLLIYTAPPPNDPRRELYFFDIEDLEEEIDEDLRRHNHFNYPPEELF